MFHRLSKHLEFRQKYSAARRIFNSVLGVWISRWNTVSHVWYITSKMTGGCRVSKYLRRSVDGKLLNRFQSETCVVKFLQCSVWMTPFRFPEGFLANFIQSENKTSVPKVVTNGPTRARVQALLDSKCRCFGKNKRTRKWEVRNCLLLVNRNILSFWWTHGCC